MLLTEFMEPMGLSQNELGVAEDRLHEVLKEVRPLEKAKA